MTQEHQEWKVHCHRIHGNGVGAAKAMVEETTALEAISVQDIVAETWAVEDTSAAEATTLMEPPSACQIMMHNCLLVVPMIGTSSFFHIILVLACCCVDTKWSQSWS